MSCQRSIPTEFHGVPTHRGRTRLDVLNSYCVTSRASWTREGGEVLVGIPYLAVMPIGYEVPAGKSIMVLPPPLSQWSMTGLALRFSLQLLPSFSNTHYHYIYS